MTEKTYNILKQVAADWLNKDMGYEDWEYLFNARGLSYFGKQTYPLSFSTFRRYAKLKKIETFKPVSVEELVELLNSCAGEDCYMADWKYVVRDGMPYECITTYQLVSIDFD